jgi:hypothetical protein
MTKMACRSHAPRGGLERIFGSHVVMGSHGFCRQQILITEHLNWLAMKVMTTHDYHDYQWRPQSMPDHGRNVGHARLQPECGAPRRAHAQRRQSLRMDEGHREACP